MADSITDNNIDLTKYANDIAAHAKGEDKTPKTPTILKEPGQEATFDLGVCGGIHRPKNNTAFKPSRLPGDNELTGSRPQRPDAITKDKPGEV
jgi:hypothetical protein